MQDLNVTLVQFDQAWEDKNGNKTKILELIKNLVETDLIVLPEMLFTGFSMNLSLVENYEKSDSLCFLKSLSKEKNAAVYTSVMIQDGGKNVNRGLFVVPSGEVTFYDKRKLFTLTKEDDYFESGETSQIVDLNGWKINLQICYDLRFPEISRNKIGDNQLPVYDLSLYVANWPERRAKHWKSLLVARAIENQAFVVGVNRIGTDGNGFSYSGDSRAISPFGDDVFDSQPGTEFVQTVVLKYDQLTEIREKMNFLKDA